MKKVAYAALGLLLWAGASHHGRWQPRPFLPGAASGVRPEAIYAIDPSFPQALPAPQRAFRVSAGRLEETSAFDSLRLLDHVPPDTSGAGRLTRGARS